jgi:hypothetical protein
MSTGDALALKIRPTTTPLASTSKSPSFHCPDGREADARLRISLIGSDLTTRYLKNFELKRKKWPFLETFLPSDVREEAAPTKEGAVDEKAIARAAERGLTAALHKYTAEIFRSIYKALLVIVGVYLVYKYGLDILGFLIAVVSMVGHALGIW